MQPHSTCALALANYAFNQHVADVTSASMSVSFINKQGEKKFTFYSLSDIKFLRDNYGRKSGLEVTVKKSGDPFSCRLSLKTSSEYIKDGSSCKIEHSVQHRAGFHEVFTFRRGGVSGEHRNSLKYGRFEGRFLHEKAIAVSTKVLQPKSNEKSDITFQIKIESI